MAERAWRNDGVTLLCLVCQQPFGPRGRQQYCSDRCRQAAWRHRQPPVLPVVPVRLPKVAIIYECGGCQERYLGEQWCPDCQRPCRRIGPGGACPHCDGAVAVVDLLPHLVDQKEGRH